jgi:hypothetical protein
MDTGGLDHINTTNTYNHDQQLSTIIYQDAGSGIPPGYGQLNLTSQAHCNYDHQLSTVNNDGPIIAKKLENTCMQKPSSLTKPLYFPNMKF